MAETKERIVTDALRGAITENEAVNSAYLKGIYQGISNCLDHPETMIEDYLRPLVEELAESEGGENG